LISEGGCDSGVSSASDITISNLEHVAAKSNISICRLMTEAYRAVGDPDGIYGCVSDQRANTVARSVEHF